MLAATSFPPQGDDYLNSQRQYVSNERMNSPTNIVERILLASEKRQGMHSAPSQVFDSSEQNSGRSKGGCEEGLLTLNEIAQLGTISSLYLPSSPKKPADSAIVGEIEVANGADGATMKNGWALVEGESLTSLSSLLEDHVIAAGSIDLISEMNSAIDTNSQLSAATAVVHWLGNGNSGCRRFSVLRRGLEAASILLSIMTSPGVDRRAVNEDAIVACIALLRQHLSKNIIPAIAQTGHLVNHVKTSPSAPQKRQRKKQKTNLAEEVKNEDAENRNRNTQKIQAALKKVYKAVLSTAGPFTVIVEKLELLIRTVSLDDQPLLSITSIALSTLAVDPASNPHNNASLCHLIQVSAVALVNAVFLRYPRHRQIVIEDLFPLMLKLPTSKRSMRTLSVSSQKTSCSENVIQMITHLTLNLIQCCVVMPSPVESGEHEKDESRLLPKLNSGLTQCRSVCDFFTAQLLSRCRRKGEDGGASEFRPILSNLIDDLLDVQLLPEYPAADMLLSSICHRLSSTILHYSSANSEGTKAHTNLESTYLNTAMDALGKICAAAAGILCHYRLSPLKLPQANDSLATDVQLTGNNETNRCFCGRVNFTDTFMLDCDRCHAWFHGNCVGITKDNLPSEWFCDECAIQITVTEQTKQFVARYKSCKKKQHSKTIAADDDVTMDISAIDETHVFRQLLINYLSQLTESRGATGIVNAKQFRIAEWVEQLENYQSQTEDSNAHEKNLIEKKLVSDILCSHYLEHWSSKLTNAATCTREGNARLMMSLVATTSNMASTFPRILGVFVQLMGDENVSLRKVSVKAISQVVIIDSNLMLQPKVRAAVVRLFTDDGISVREAVVNLVGSYVLKDKLVADAFHSPLIARLSDVGKSVRKRTVKIFREILLSHPDYKGRTEACTKMLQRAADPKEDDSVRDLIFETFQDIWFDTQPGFNSMKGADRHVHTAAMQMVDVVLSSGSPDFLAEFVKEMMFGLIETDKDKKVLERQKRKGQAKIHCAHLVDALVEELLSFEEKRSRQPVKPENGPRLVALLSTICMFAESLPTLLVQHVDTMLPYLKADNGLSREEESTVVDSVSRLIARVTPVLQKTEVQRLSNGEICEDLLRITYNFGSTALNAAIEALASLAGHEDADYDNLASKTLMKLVSTFYSYLFKVKDVTNDFSCINPQLKNNIHRALSVLGAVCRYYSFLSRDLADDDLVNSPVTEPSSLSATKSFSSCYAILRLYLEKNDSSTKCAALRAMTGLFISRPRTFLAVEHTGLIDHVMSPDSPPLLQAEALLCWKHVLLSEEKRIESGEAKKQMNSKDISLSQKISGDQDSDATLAGGVLNHHAQRLFEMTSSQDPSIRFAAIELIGNLLRQGLINPMETVPYLLALQGDLGFPDIRSLALKLLIIEGEKRPDMLRQRVRAGIRQAYLFQRKLYPDNNYVSAVVKGATADEGVECIFGPIFKESVKTSKVQKQGLFTSLLSLFHRTEAEGTGEFFDESSVAIENKPLAVNSSKKKKKRLSKDVFSRLSFSEKLPLLSYAAQVLAHLPYESYADPLFITYHISCITAVQGAQLLDRFVTFLGTDEVDIDNSEEDDLERAARLAHPSAAKEASFVSDPNFDLKHFTQMCAEASTLLLLLRLRAFLKKVYSLSDTKCAEYHPSQKERIGEKSVSQSQQNRIFNNRIETFLIDQGIQEQKQNVKETYDKDVLIQLYAEFRRLMRGDAGVRDMFLQDGGTSHKSGRTGAKRPRQNEIEL